MDGVTVAPRSVPVLLCGKTYHLRFSRADIKAIENQLGIGYRHFIRPGIFGSLTATESFLWRGLYAEGKDGSLSHVFEQTDDGREAAGDLFWEHNAAAGEAIDDTLIEAFIASGLFRKRDDTIDTMDSQTAEEDGKNRAA